MHTNTSTHYSFLSMLGQGGQGKMFLVLDQYSGKLVTIKQAPNHILDHEYSVLTHIEKYGGTITGVPRLLNTIAFQNTKGLVLEYIIGRAIHQFPARSISLSVVLQWITEFFTILSRLHMRGVVHHDLSQKNILVDINGSLHIIDFGMAACVTSQPFNAFRCDVADMICLAED